VPPEFETWLKTTIPGIIILGAFGSIVAILAVRSYNAIMDKIYKPRQGRQAFILGFTAALMNDDETSKMSSSFLVFHLACLIIWLASVIIFVEIFLFSINEQLPIFTVGGVIAVIGVLLSIYFGHFEFEYIYRTYLFFWGRSLRRAAERHRDLHPSGGDGTPTP
jgi:hypothetical protein